MSKDKSRRWGIIDIGSNTVRLCVYDISPNNEFKRLASAKMPTALSSYVNEANVLSKEGIVAGIKSVRKLCRMAELMNCDMVAPFATAALRNCDNSEEAVAAIEREAECKIQVLSGKDEARLSLSGALLSAPFKSGLFFDIGGGSTELMTVKTGEFVDGDSIPLGSLTSWAREVEGILPTAEELNSLGQAVGILLDESQVKLDKHAQVCGIGGTMRLALKMARITNEDISDRSLHLTNFDAMISAYLDDPETFSRHLLQLNPARIHTFLPGCVIAREILLRAGADRMYIAKSGVREGYLLSLLG